MTHRVVTLGGAQSQIRLVTERTDMSVLEPSSSIYDRHSLRLANGVAFVQPHQPAKVPVANFSVHDGVLKKDDVTGFRLPHPRPMVKMRAMSRQRNEDETDRCNVEHSSHCSTRDTDSSRRLQSRNENSTKTVHLDRLLE